MKPTPFPSKTTPWRVQLPASWNNGKRKTRYFADEKEAIAFCNKVKRYGKAALQENTPAVAKSEATRYESLIRHAADVLGDPGLVHEALEHFRRTRMNINRMTVREAVEAFHADCKTQVRTVEAPQNKYSARTVKDHGDQLRKLLKRFSDVQLSELTDVDLRTFLKGISYGSRRTVYKTVRVFFGWALENKHIGENPMIQIKSKTMPAWGVNNEPYPVETFRRMLRVAAGLEGAKPDQTPTREFIDLLPYFVLSGFAGLRSGEVIRDDSKGADALRWTDIRFGAQTPNIEIRVEIAKKTMRKTNDAQYVDARYAIDAVNAWLALYPQNKSLWVCPWTSSKIYQLKAKFAAATGIKFIRNGLRNSFGTYALAYCDLNGLGHVAKQMRNSEDICRRHYVRNLLTGAGKAWFDLRPFEVIPAIDPAVVAEA